MIRRGSWDDFDAVYELTATPQSRREHMRWHWDLPSFDPARHLWLAKDDRRLLAYAMLRAPDLAAARGDPELIPALLEHVEAQAREEGLEQLEFVIPPWDEAACRAYERAGFELATEVLEMEITLDGELPEPSLPDGVTLRTYTDADANAVRELLDEAYVGWDDTYIRLEHEDWLAFMTEHESFDPESWFLAERDGELVGVCLNWKEGWVKDIAVAPAARGLGLGEALLRHSFARLRERGVRKFGLKVDAWNPTSAIRLYERVGMRVAKRHLAYMKKL